MTSAEPFPVGKIDPDLLRELLAERAPEDGRVLLGPGLGRDVAVLDFGETALAVKSDPVTFATDALGWYAVHVNANDIATCGARPRWFLATLLLPEGSTTAALVRAIFAQMREACAALNIALVGGHTEVTYGLDRPVLCGQMLGEAPRAKLVLPTGIRVGDAVLMTKAVAVEGTSLLAREAAGRLREAGCTEAELEEGAGYLFRPGISVAPEAELLMSSVRVHAMHDPTEGGLATGLWEMAQAGGVGIEVGLDRIPRLPLCERFCALLGLEPLGLIASGTLLAAVDAADATRAVEVCSEAGIPCAEIGIVTDRAGEVGAVTPEGRRGLSRFDQDEVARVVG
jgi:hydrogenase maturation factor